MRGRHAPSLTAFATKEESVLPGHLSDGRSLRHRTGRTHTVDGLRPRIYPQLMQVSLEYAKEHLADLVSAAYRGEEVEIAAPDQPAVRFTLVGPADASKEPQSLLGSGKGEIWLADDWDSPETNGEIADLFENSVIFPNRDPDQTEDHPGA